MTPAQAYGHPTLDDVPVQGPTDPGIRAADCYYAKNFLPAQPSCVDSKGPIPMWAQSNGILAERINFGGLSGFSLSAATDPEIWSKISPQQQAWVAATLNTLNDQIVKKTGSSCPTWGPAINMAGGCFQVWFNANYGAKFTGANGAPIMLRTDGVFDQDTLDALRTVAGLNPQDFPTPYPGTSLPGLTGEGKKLSTAAMWGIGGGAAAVLGGIAYVATRKKSRRK